MANQQMTKSDDPDLFLQFLLRCALSAPGASSSPTAGRILARLLVVGALEGGDGLVTPFLVPVPDEEAIFEVRAYRPGNLEPTETRSGLAAAAALRIALRAARDSDDGIEVVSQTRSGLERCVLVRDSTGDFEFRYASGETLTGRPADCAAARRAWTLKLAEWRAWVAETHPVAGRAALATTAPALDESVLPSGDLPPAPALAHAPELVWDRRSIGRAVDDSEDADGEDTGDSEDADGEDTGDSAPATGAPWASPTEPEPGSGWWVRPSGQPTGELDGPDGEEATSVEDTGHPGPDEAEHAPTDGSDARHPDPDTDDTPNAEAETVEEEAVEEEEEEEEEDAIDLDDTTVEVPVAEGLGSPKERRPDDDLTRPQGGDPEAPMNASLSPDAQAMVAAIRADMANLRAGPDLTDVEELIRRALTGNRDLVEPLARRLSARLGESLGLPDTRDFVDAVLPLIPRPGEVAEAVTADVTALLSEVILRRRAGEFSGGAEGQGIIGAIEKMQVQLDGIHDQVRKSSGALQSIDERMELNDRRGAAAERIGASIEQEMQRLALRIDEQVAALAANAGGGSELADGVARLTRKLRQSVAQLDRALVRLDDVVDHPALGQAGSGGQRQGPRRALSPSPRAQPPPDAIARSSAPAGGADDPPDRQKRR